LPPGASLRLVFTPQQQQVEKEVEFESEEESCRFQLSDWVGIHVLARKRDQCYYPGCLVDALSPAEGFGAAVQFDEGSQEPVLYENLFHPDAHDSIISDSIPSSSEISVGNRVGIKERQGAFLPGLVYESELAPLKRSRFLVKADASEEKRWSSWVMRDLEERFGANRQDESMAEDFLTPPERPSSSSSAGGEEEESDDDDLRNEDISLGWRAR
ncbi:Uncharacterized protein FKW44_013399, partial [Caligus rogercresseyi]